MKNSSYKLMRLPMEYVVFAGAVVIELVFIDVVTKNRCSSSRKEGIIFDILAIDVVVIVVPKTENISFDQGD